MLWWRCVVIEERSFVGWFMVVWFIDNYYHLNDDQARQPPAFTNSIAMGSLSDDLREIMKTLASNIITLQ
jgi:hypothetical protein